MKRDLHALERTVFDLVVIGGGIFGAAAAWNAARRGLSVALIDRHDFSGATSAHCFKLVHGGMRYLQHADIYRIRQSSAARRTFLRVAPHLVQPLPIVVPTYGIGMRSRWIMRAAMAAYDTVTADRNRGIADATRCIPSGSCLSREDVLALYPGIHREGLSGAAVFCDAQMYNPPRLVLAFLKSATGAGAVAANYVEADRFLVNGHRVHGVEARDTLTGSSITIRGRCVLNAAGPYAEGILQRSLGQSLAPPTHWSRDAFFVVARPLVGGQAALALQSQTQDPDARLSRGGRHLFLVPWRDYTLVGVWHKVYRGHPDDASVTEDELQSFVDDINQKYSGIALSVDDISVWNAGLIPFGENDPDAEHLRFGHRSRLVDHAKEHGIEGLVTLIGVRFTTGPSEAANAVDLVLHKARTRRPAPGDEPLHGGSIADFEGIVGRIVSGGLSRDIAERLAHNHGAAYSSILDCSARQPDLAKTVARTKVLRAEVVHAVREEMAQTLADVVLRRTDMGTGCYPGQDALQESAALMGQELGWDTSKLHRELDNVIAMYPDRFRRPLRANLGLHDDAQMDLPRFSGDRVAS